MDAVTALRNAAKRLNAAADIMQKSEENDDLGLCEYADEMIALAFADLQEADYVLEDFVEQALNVA